MSTIGITPPSLNPPPGVHESVQNAHPRRRHRHPDRSRQRDTRSTERDTVGAASPTERLGAGARPATHPGPRPGPCRAPNTTDRLNATPLVHEVRQCIGHDGRADGPETVSGGGGGGGGETGLPYRRGGWGRLGVGRSSRWRRWRRRRRRSARRSRSRWRRDGSISVATSGRSGVGAAGRAPSRTTPPSITSTSPGAARAPAAGCPASTPWPCWSCGCGAWCPKRSRRPPSPSGPVPAPGAPTGQS